MNSFNQVMKRMSWICSCNFVMWRTENKLNASAVFFSWYNAYIRTPQQNIILWNLFFVKVFLYRMFHKVFPQACSLLKLEEIVVPPCMRLEKLFEPSCFARQPDEASNRHRYLLFACKEMFLSLQCFKMSLKYKNYPFLYKPYNNKWHV